MHVFPAIDLRGGKVVRLVLRAGTALLVFILLFADVLRGEDKYPDPAALAAATPYKNTFFDPDPNHPWNQLYGLLFIRPAWDGKLYGLDEMDPLYWTDTRYLLEGPLHQKALAVLDKFIQSDSAHLIKDPLKRALLQRMLWALFDNLAAHENPNDQNQFAPERRELEIRLVKIMKSVALTDDEIGALPDNCRLEIAAKTYSSAFDQDHVDQPFLPGPFLSGSDWIDLENVRDPIVAPVHVRGISGRSVFHVLLRFPTGRADTLAYLKKLEDFKPYWIDDWNKMVSPEQLKSEPSPPPFEEDPPWVNPNLPQVLPLTEFALVRMANLIDTKGEIVNSPLVESIQIRVIRRLIEGLNPDAESFCMFTLDQTKLMEGEGGLIAETKSNWSFDLVLDSFRILSGDYLERQDKRATTWNGKFEQLTSCSNCHQGAGIFSMNSYTHNFGDRPLRPTQLWPTNKVSTNTASTGWKHGRYNWGVLQTYWFAQ